MKKVLLCLLIAVLVIQYSGMTNATFALENQTIINEQENVTPQLKNGTAIIHEDDDLSTIKEILAKALVSNFEEIDVQSLQWEYYCTGKNGLLTNDAWGSIEGFTSQKKVAFVTTTYTHPSLANNSDGDYRIRLAGTEDEVILTKKMNLDSQIILKNDCSVKLAYNEDLTVDYEALKEAVFNTIVDSTTPALTLDDVTISYYATATTGAIGSLGKAWVDLAGGKVNLISYPGITEGEQLIKVSFAGNDEYGSVSAEVSVNFIDRNEMQWNLKEGPYEIDMVFNDDQSYDYSGIEKAIINTVIASTDPELNESDIKVEYNASATGLGDNYQPLDNKDVLNLKKFGAGTWQIRLSWNGNLDYKAGSVVVEVTVTDNRLASKIVCKDGGSFTYNVDSQVMKQDILNNVIDWQQSILPESDTLDIDDFTIEYYGENVLTDNVNGGVKQWAPIEGGKVNLLTYPQMGAGEQKIRISYNGNGDYRPSETVETTVSVNKATVKVTVHSTNIYADEVLPEDFITTNPVDKFDQYQIYAGITSNVTTAIYLNLPARYTDTTVLKILDPIVEKIYGKTFTEIMNDGITVGELRQLLSTQELLDLLDELNIDTGVFGQVLEVINKLPSLVDSVNVAFGTPNKAGLYLTTVVTDNKNYETGVGVGMLLVKMRASGIKLMWNETIENGKMTVDQAANFDFNATLTYNGEALKDQSNIHYLYTGVTSKFRLYSSTTTPPTEPGRYVVTVVTLGGNYLAAPITRTFQITK